jgi:hypothetical protein
MGAAVFDQPAAECVQILVEVPKRRLSLVGSASGAPIRMQAVMNFLPTSIPAQRSMIAFILPSCLVEEQLMLKKDALPRALRRHSGVPIYVRQASFHYG